MVESRRKYYWLLAEHPDTGRPFLIAGGNTEEEARIKGLEELGGLDFEIKPLPTTNLASASAMIRGKRLEETHSLRSASERIGHERTVRRTLRRRRVTNGN